jgi:hypothetical protein
MTTSANDEIMQELKAVIDDMEKRYRGVRIIAVFSADGEYTSMTANIGSAASAIILRVVADAITNGAYIDADPGNVN